MTCVHICTTDIMTDCTAVESLRLTAIFEMNLG